MTPTERLTAFVADMLQWEISLNEQRRAQKGTNDPSLAERISQNAREKLRLIFGEHLSAKALATRAQSRLDLLDTGRPPEFAQRILADTESRTGKTTYIETFRERGHLAPRRRYALVIEGDEPKIDVVYAWRDSTGKWAKQDSI
ncbi:RhsIA family immunity protein [Burkholderia sp. AU30280]|uniref:NTF2 fold immunity protein n=1 Tax=Burkholderia sp. AU30280 TaxID=2879628 RepID=UPI001CF5DEF6|nr:NTF2 fold immunity protein [Burkholderia sp. AU30280]MCA8277904.1 RhsIA family immunity protein [Burkholderia sp. AU30280]